MKHHNSNHVVIYLFYLLAYFTYNTTFFSVIVGGNRGNPGETSDHSRIAEIIEHKSLQLSNDRF